MFEGEDPHMQGLMNRGLTVTFNVRRCSINADLGMATKNYVDDKIFWNDENTK